MAVVVQPGFLIPVLALEADGVSEACFSASLSDGLARFAPGLVAGAPGDLALVVGQLLRGAQVVAHVSL